MQGQTLTQRSTCRGPSKRVLTNHRVPRGVRAAVATGHAKVAKANGAAILHRVEELPDGTVVLRFAAAGTGGMAGSHVEVERNVVEFLQECTTTYCRLIDNDTIDQIVGTHVPLQPAQQLTHLVTTTAHNTVSALKETLSGHTHQHHHAPATIGHASARETQLTTLKSTPAPAAVAALSAASPRSAAAAAEDESSRAIQLAPSAAKAVAPVVLVAAAAAVVQVAKAMGLLGKLPENALKAFAQWSWPAAAVIVAVAAGLIVWSGLNGRQSSGKTLQLTST
ncbi:unnamed protein product [Closterium sp. Naga37s-1]|nr:unnamed protein product [Closterium sp. Naga37s-1]CAI5501917.1 unnamed protein product [Closterium sp. Naga37s-1]